MGRNYEVSSLKRHFCYDMCVNTDRPTSYYMKHTKSDALINDCEDYLLQRYIPLHSYNSEEIISQAVKEGYMMDLFHRNYSPTT